MQELDRELAFYDELVKQHAKSPEYINHINEMKELVKIFYRLRPELLSSKQGQWIGLVHGRTEPIFASTEQKVYDLTDSQTDSVLVRKITSERTVHEIA